MGGLCERLKNASTRVWRYLFPKRIDPPECVLELLRFIYPTVDWSRVSFYEGWPHLIGLSPNAAITLPDTYTPHRINVYFRPGRWDPCSCAGLGLIVHEGFHVLQISDMLGGMGAGFARPFIVQYLACWAGNGFDYDGHPMEDAAYQVAGRSTSLYESCCNGSRRACNCDTELPSVDEAGLAAFKANCANVVQQSSGFNFWRDMAECTPGLMALHRAAQWLLDKTCRADIPGTIPLPTRPGSGPTDPSKEPPPMEPPTRGPEEEEKRNVVHVPVRWIACLFGLAGAGVLYLLFGIYYALWMLVWSIVTIALWLVKIIAEIIGTIAAGIIWVITGIVCGIQWLWERFKELLGRICRWGERLERQCTEWQETRERKCTEEKEERERKCTQAKEERERKCSETKEERTKNCCTWWPCSWACKAWTWVVNVVCVAWTWVVNVICVAWAWVTNVVCVAWTWVVSRTCKAFTWVVKGITCW
jgi:hypothetical protein